ncbi:hypothetical protein L1987_09366 [Smallanthus sonchifolius]|uniref:Uncharacterized protein n=1 Tax=Smallanthus sonchifolius TaxID=185202 RepID=A0ACB9JNN9_9ASTR|nr:hypothetical protein L1987_09366 [Smallanthus sonchifolius]
MDVEEAVTTAGPSNDQKDCDNIAKTSTTATHSDDVSLETPFTERNPRCQETMGDGDEEARPKAPSGSKDSTAVDEDRLQLHILELTAKMSLLLPTNCCGQAYLLRTLVLLLKNKSAADSLIRCRPKLLWIGFSATSTLDAADRQIISSFGWLHLAADHHLCC